MERFSDFINEFGLVEPITKGGSFTWCSLRDKPTFSKLDRFIISPELVALWSRVSQYILPRGLSNYNPVCLMQETYDWGPKPFKWFDNWFEENELMVNIQEVCEAVKGSGVSNILKAAKKRTKE
ncbi:hypothetical protein HRI_002973800 [Hibiscus trionum]|uniref:Uncharacterized protein n=1 Tax=Hibiscus trionum TaxID=183268 RepID=A0A9W7IAX6_HIBTR|nr:hypothetical protein HRI_002973800 [Hibiscus trionum]